MPLRKWLKSANDAIEGILTAAKNERHLRYHLYAAAIVLLFSYSAGVTKTEFLIISTLSLFVIMAELINTAIEATVDLLSPKRREEARIAKDVAAGAVMCTATGAAIIGYIILFPYLKSYFENGLYIAKHAENEVAVFALIFVFILVILTKAFTGKGHPLRGGMPSGHSAVSFSFWVSITVMTENALASLLSLTAAVMIAQSRVTIHIHSVWEVILGALMGSTVTYVLFKIFT